MKLTESTEKDIDQLTRWIEQDQYHKGLFDPRWWLTGSGILSFKIEDSTGTTMYVRMEKQDDLMRIYTQFAPESEVSKSRAAKSILWCIPRMKIFAESQQLKGFIYDSTSTTLVMFMMKKYGFIPIGNDNYRLLFEDGTNVRS